MQNQYLAIIPFIGPLLLTLFAISSLFLSKKSSHSKRVTESMGLVGIFLAAISIYLIVEYGTLESALLGSNGLGFSMRLDTLSVTFFSMIAILGYVILRFSYNYLDGDSRKSIFFGRLAITIAAVQMLILSGNLFQILFFWMITSVCLHYLLVFYRNRPQAIAAARKKFIIARVGDLTLLSATILVYTAFGTGNLGEIFQSIGESSVNMNMVGVGANLFGIAAVLKSAQFPTHGWLIEVVETPTPVSALLHAGLLNAGPFLMVRLSHLMVESVSASILLIIVGGFTALYASVVYMTQPSIKVSLGYSSVAHMGFSLLLCGLGVYSAAVLHVVAHSFYKAHAFLSSGSAVDILKSRKVSVPKRYGRILPILISILIATGIYAAFAYWRGMDLNTDFSLFIIGAVVIMGLSQMLTNMIDAKGSFELVVFTIGLSLLVTLSFFGLEHLSRELMGVQIPDSIAPSFAIKLAASILIATYAIAIGAQLFAPRLKQMKLGYRLGVHLRNGLYVNVIFDRLIGSLKHEKFKWVNLAVVEEPEKEKLQTESNWDNIETIKETILSQSL